jgi:hypothetical protein
MRARGIYILLLLSLFAASIALPSTTSACSPRYRPGPDSAEAVSDVVFVGRIVSISTDPLNILSPHWGAKSILFEISSTWKGIDQTQAIVQAWDSACGHQFVTFIAGDEYLVYSNVHERSGMLVDQLIMPHYKAEEYLAALGQGSPPAHQVKLQQPLTVTSVVIATCFVIPLAVILALFLIRRSKSTRPQ